MSGTQQTDADNRQTRNTIGLTLLLGSLTMFGPISIDMYLPSLPAIARSLGTDAAGAKLTVAAFTAGLAIGQLVYGPLSDRIGRRKPLMIGISLFVVVTIGCAYATSIEVLIGLRFLQALGASVGMVVARAVVADLFHPSEAARMYSLLTLVFGIAPILAPTVGGWILYFAHWEAIFLALAAFGVVVLAAAMARLEESRSAETLARSQSESPIRAYGAVITQRRLLGFALAGASGGSSIFIYIAASPDLLIETFKVPSEYYGLLFGVNAIGFVVASQVNRYFLKQYSPQQMLARGTGFGLLMALVLVGVSLAGGGLVPLLVPLFFVISALGLIMPNGVAGAMAVDLQRSGSSAALIGSLQFVFGTAGALSVSIFHDGSALPMAATIAAMLLLSNLFLWGLVGREPAAESAS